jgi:hypothetical protein
MGYNTRYELYAAEANGKLSQETQDAIARWVRGSENRRLALQDYGGINEACNWYDWETDLRTLSASLPHVWFVLSGWGEAIEDIWKAYAKAGKLEKVKPEYKFKVPGFFKLKH